MAKLTSFLVALCFFGIFLLSLFGGASLTSALASEEPSVSEPKETSPADASEKIANEEEASAMEEGEEEPTEKKSDESSEFDEEKVEAAEKAEEEEEQPSEEPGEEPAEEPLFTPEEIFQNNLELLAEEEFRKYHGEISIGYAFQDNSGLADFRYRYDYPNKAFYLPRLAIRSLHPSHEFLDVVVKSPREKSYFGTLSMIKDHGTIDIVSSCERFKGFGIYRDGTLFSNPFRFTTESLYYHNPSYQDWWFDFSLGYIEFERENNRINTQADTRGEWVHMNFTFAPYKDASLNLSFIGERIYRDIGGEKARDAYTYSSDLTDPLSEDTTLQAGFSYTFAETYSLGGELDRYRAYINLLGDRAFGHDCLDWKLHFNYLNNAGFAYVGASVDDKWSLGGNLSYSSGKFGVFSAGYTFADTDLKLLDFSSLPYELKISPFALESEYEPYRVFRSPKSHNFVFSHRVNFGLGFRLKEEVSYERVRGIADLSVLDFRYKNIFPTRRFGYRAELSYEPCENWRYLLSERYERRKNTIRNTYFVSNYVSLSATYSPEEDSAYTVLIGRSDFNHSDPTISLYETDLSNAGFVFFKRFNPRLSLHTSYNFSYSTGRDKFESDDFSLYLALSGKVPIRIGYEYSKLSEKLYPQATSRVHNLFIEYEYKF